jgi:hypothetical protein
MMLILVNVCLICSLGILNWVCKCFIEGMRVVARTLAVITIKDATFQPCE